MMPSPIGNTAGNQSPQVEELEGAGSSPAEGLEGNDSTAAVKQPQTTSPSSSAPQVLPMAPSSELGLESASPPGSEALPEGNQESLNMLMQSVNDVRKDSGRGHSGGGNSDNSGHPETSGDTAPLQSQSSVDGSSSASSEADIIREDVSGFMQHILQILQYDTKRENINSSINQLHTDSNQFQRKMEEKLQMLEDKISGTDARLASKILTWVTLIVGAVVSAVSLGTLTGPMALLAGVIGLTVAAYSISQQAASEATDGQYTIGQEWTMLLEACGVDPAEAEQIGPILNTTLTTVLSLFGAGFGIGAAVSSSSKAASTAVSTMGTRMARIGFGGEVTSVFTDGSSSASAISVSGIDLKNGLTDAEVKLLDACLQKMGLNRDKLISYLQSMMQGLDSQADTVMQIFMSWQQTNSTIARTPTMM